MSQEFEVPTHARAYFASRSHECASRGTGRPHFSQRQRSQIFVFAPYGVWQRGQNHFSTIAFTLAMARRF